GPGAISLFSPRATCVVPARLPGECQDTFCGSVPYKVLRREGLSDRCRSRRRLPATTNPEFSKNRLPFRAPHRLPGLDRRSKTGTDRRSRPYASGDTIPGFSSNFKDVDFSIVGADRK